jgi:hypothetical protein
MMQLIMLPKYFLPSGCFAVRRVAAGWEILEPIADGFEQRPRLRRTIIDTERSPAPPSKQRFFQRRKLHARPQRHYR